jgi:hypothetical protein
MTTRQGRQLIAPAAGAYVTPGGTAGAAPASQAAARLQILVDISRRLAEPQPDLEVVLDA